MTNAKPLFRRSLLGTTVLVALGFCAGAGNAQASRFEEAQEKSPGPHYEVLFEARVQPTQREARVAWKLDVGSAAVKEITLFIDPDRHFEFSGDGELDIEGDRVRWRPGKGKTALRYRFKIDRTRDDGGYDARCNENWALFRGDDLFPPARVRTETGAKSVSVLRLKLPRGWSSTTSYANSGRHTYEIDDRHRRFDRPTGWMLVGRLGVLRERVAGSQIAVAGPVGQNVRRQDMLAFLRWNLPSLRNVLGALPERMLVVSAGDPMWRGGLSGPRSLYVHADRPLIANDGTSPVLHELFHSATRTTSGADGDWIVEGLAEYYSLLLQLRSKTISRNRYLRAIEKFEVRGAEAELVGRNSGGDATARAVTVLRGLDEYIRSQTSGEHDLDDVVAAMAVAPREITTDDFRTIAEETTGLDLGRWFAANVGDIEDPSDRSAKTAALKGGP